MWDIIGVCIGAAGLLYTVYYVRRISRTLDIIEDPDKAAPLINRWIQTFKMSLMGKQSGYVKRKSKMEGLMQDFVVEDLAPDLVEGMVPGVPPILVRWLAAKLNESELGDYLRENPELFPDALGMAGSLMSKFMEAQAGQSLAQPQGSDQQGSW